MRRAREWVAALLPVLLPAAMALPAGPAAAADPGIAEKVAASYPEVLALWAGGEAERALDELVALETPLVRPEKADRDIEDLWRAKLGVIRDTIERGSIEVLVPIMLLHHDAYPRYVEERASRLANHSVVMSAELAEFYAGKSAASLAATRAGDLLTSLGGLLQSRNITKRSADLFARALDLDPSNAAAHMGLGALYERHGELPEATQHYETAARLDSSSAEAALRGGICVARQGELELAERQFDRAVELGEPDWVVRFALQEKARLKDDAAAGEGVAREGYRRFPDSSRQAIQLAFMLERERRSGSALEILGGITGDAEPESERYRYARWPSALLDVVRGRLRQSAADQNGALASATSGGEPMTASP